MGLTLEVIRERLHAHRPEAVTDPGARQAAVALILMPTVDDMEVLFIRRSHHPGDPWSGQMALPGGRRDPGDRSRLQTSIREAEEETGISLVSESLLGQLDDYTPRTPVLPQIVIRPFVFGLAAVPVLKPSGEVAYHRWVSLTTLRAAATTVELEIAGKPAKVPAFVLGQDVVWGLTERIIKPFIDLLH